MHSSATNTDYKGVALSTAQSLMPMGLGGFFGYMLDVSVVQGSNANIECVHRTLLKLAQTYKTWPVELYVQLDNTAKDNKNKATLGYFGYLVGSGVFKRVIVSFLPVGHTHEDIDAVFGMIMRWLHRHRSFYNRHMLTCN